MVNPFLTRFHVSKDIKVYTFLKKVLDIWRFVFYNSKAVSKRNMDD